MASAAYVVGVVMTIVSGISLATQSGVNATLGKYAGKGFASIISFSMGLVCCVIFFAIQVGGLHSDKPTAQGMRDAPWWSWLGGLLGAVYVIVVIIFAQELGAGTLTGIFVSAQLITAVIWDVTGIVGFPRRVFSWPRIVGAVMLIGGVALISAFPGELADAPLPPQSPPPAQQTATLSSAPQVPLPRGSASLVELGLSRALQAAGGKPGEHHSGWPGGADTATTSASGSTRDFEAAVVDGSSSAQSSKSGKVVEMSRADAT